MVQKTINIWDVDVNNIVILNLIERNNNSKFFIGYLDEVIKPLPLVLPNMSRYVKALEIKMEIRLIN